VTAVEWRPVDSLLGESRPNRDPAYQAKLRADVDASQAVTPLALLAQVAAHKKPVEAWSSEALCSADNVVTIRPTGRAPKSLRVRDLFFPQPDGDWSDPADDMKVEHGRNSRLEMAAAFCTVCPARDHCYVWGIAAGGSDKVAFIGGLTWSQRKKVSIETRCRAKQPATGTVDHTRCGGCLKCS